MRLAFFLTLALLLAGGAWVQSSSNMKSSAPDKMTPPGEAEKMRACDKMAMDRHVAMQERAQFVKNCMRKMK